MKVLGYSHTEWSNYDRTLPFFQTEVEGEALKVMETLSSIDTQITDAIGESMAVQVGELSLNYSRHLAILKSEGSRHLRNLSNIMGIPIKYNKYVGHGNISYML